MACCGGGGNRSQRIRKQIVPSAEKQSAPVPVQRKLSRKPKADGAVSIQRQYVVPRQQCTKCGYPGMLVIIAGRERMQCSNTNCRIVFP